MNIDQILDKIYALSNTSKQELKQSITEVDFPKGHILLRAEKIERSIFFMKKGIARVYTHTAENEITFLFCKEGDTIVL